MNDLLKPSYYIDSDSPSVREFASSAAAGAATDREKAVKIYYAVRDGIKYNPYAMTLDRAGYRASFILSQGNGWCVQKAILLAAAARAGGIPARLRFANVINHLVTERLKEIMKTNLFVFHGLVDLFLEGKWVKATPAFNLSLCEKFGVLPLEFDGRSDSIFHPFDRAGRRHMEYVHDYGPFDDFPFEKMIEESKKYYPHFFASESVPDVRGADFEAEAAAEREGK